MKRKILSLKIFTLLILQLIISTHIPIYAAEFPIEGPFPENYPELYFKKPYLQNPAVAEIQEALRNLGYYNGYLSGQYDEKTEEAVRLFQKDVGIKVDGVISIDVWMKLARETESTYSRSKLKSPQGDITIIIDTFRRRLTVYSDNEAYASFPVAIGKSSTPSPIGCWKIINKAMNWGTGFGTRWLGLNVPWGIYGIHGTNKPWSIGTMASHGCFRMLNQDVELIYSWIKTGTSVIVVGNPFGYMSGGLRRLKRGINCSQVLYVQEILKRRGFYKGSADGLFGYGTVQAVKAFQKHEGLPVTGEIGYTEYKALGIR